MLVVAGIMVVTVSCQVPTDTTREPAPVSRIELTSQMTTMRINGSIDLNAVAQSESGQDLTGRTITWTSNNQAVVTVDPSGLASGHAKGEARVTASAGGVSASVELTVELPPAIGLEIENVEFVAAEDGSDPAPQIVQVNNDGDGTLSDLSVQTQYAAGQPTGWLTADLDGGVEPTSLTLTASLAPLGLGANGSFDAAVTVSSPDPEIDSMTLDIRFDVTATYTLTVQGDGNGSGSGSVRVISSVPMQAADLAAGQSDCRIDEGGDATGTCEWTYPSGTSVTLEAEPDIGSEFDDAIDWTGCDGVVPGCTVTMNADRGVTALFRGGDPRIVVLEDIVVMPAVQWSPDAETQHITIRNGGGGDLGELSVGPIVYDENLGFWLHAEPDPGDPSILAVTGIAFDDDFNNNVFLPPGTHVAHVPILAENAVDPAWVEVRIQVQPGYYLIVRSDIFTEEVELRGSVIGATGTSPVLSCSLLLADEDYCRQGFPIGATVQLSVEVDPPDEVVGFTDPCDVDNPCEILMEASYAIRVDVENIGSRQAPLITGSSATRDPSKDVQCPDPSNKYHLIRIDYDDSGPFTVGNVPDPVPVSWTSVYQPSGRLGTSLMSEVDRMGDRGMGTVEFPFCADFQTPSETSVELTVSIFDNTGVESDPVIIVILAGG